MDHSGLDRELINSPLACWDSRQGELSASSVSGRARGELLETKCTRGIQTGGRWIRTGLCGALWARPPAPQVLSVHSFTAAQRKSHVTRDKLPCQSGSGDKLLLRLNCESRVMRWTELIFEEIDGCLTGLYIHGCLGIETWPASRIICHYNLKKTPKP